MKLKNYLNVLIRKLLYRKQNEKKGVSVICNNCTAAMMLHDLGFGFNTPTVNLWMNVRDYIIFVKSLPDILNEEIEDITPPNSSYPIGILAGRIRLNFQHYNSFDEAVRKWKERSKRVDMDNLYLMCVDTGDDNILLDYNEFENLKAKKKVVFTRYDNLNLPSVYYIKGFANKRIMRITDFISWNGRRYYDDFDFEDFFKN